MAAESNAVAARTLFTQESVPLLSQRPSKSDNRVPSTIESSAATIVAAALNTNIGGGGIAFDGQSGAVDHNALFADFALYLEGVALDFSQSLTLGKDSSPDLNSPLALVIRGLLDDERRSFPLERASGTTWKLEGFIQLPKKVKDLEIVAESEFAGSLGSATLSAEELVGAYRFPDNVEGIITKYMSNAGPTLTLNVGRVRTSNTFITPAADPFDHGDPHVRVEEGLYALSQALDLFSRCRNSGNPADLEEVSTCLKRALSLLPHTSLERIDALTCLSISLQTRFGITGNTDDLNGSIDASEEEIAMLSVREDEGRLCNALTRHALGVYNRHKQFGNDKDLQQAISSQRRCLSFKEERSKAAHWVNLGAFLLCRFERFGQLDDINEAIRVHETAIDQEPDGVDELPFVLAYLGTALYARFKRTGDIEDLERALSHLKEALSRSGPDDSGPALRFILNNLGGVLMRRFERFGELADVNDAIAAYHRVIRITPDNNPSNDPSQFTLLNNLSLALKSQYSRSGDTETIMEAVNTLKLAVQTTPDDHPTLPITLNNLATAFMELFGRTKDVTHIKEAIEAQEIAISILPQGHPFLSPCLDNLGVNFSSLFKLNGDSNFIDKAVDAHRRALEYSSTDYAEYIIILFNLGKAMRLRCNQDISSPNFQADIAEAISIIETALGMLPEGHSGRTQIFHALAQCYKARFSATKVDSDLKSAASYFADAALYSTSTPQLRFESSREWTECAMMQTDLDQTLVSLNTGVELIALVAGMEQTMERRYERIPELSSFVLDAVALVTMVGHLDAALKWLEQGRGLVWSQLSSLRTPLDTLNTFDPALAKSFRDVCKKLEKAGAQEKTLAREQATMDQKMTLHEEAAVHFRLAKEREELLDRIRTSVPGFENFLRPLPSSAFLENLPKSGPVIVLIIHAIQCNAIALQAGSDGPIHIPLSNFSFDQAMYLRKLFQKTINDYGLEGRGTREEGEEDARGIRIMKRELGAEKTKDTIIEFILRHLWLGIAKPVVDALNMQPSTKKPTRIWWCVTGPSTFLPIHAAGIYRGPEAIALDDYAASSYIPTISSLSERVKNTRATSEKSSGLLLITQPAAPGLPRIPGTRIEVAKINQHADDHGIRSLRLDDEHATVDSVLKAMESYSCVHLACHAKQNAQPLRSGFYLNDGPLELSAIVKMHLKSADLAFLSACQTSMGSDNLSEEAVHLAAGMLAAGYRGVVATMWAIQDRYAVELADDFYRDLLERNNLDREDKVIEGSDAAYSLHYAVRALRQRHGNSEACFFAWVPYVHYGI